MAWTRSDDTTLLHPKVLRLGRGGDDRTVNEAYGFVARCCTWSGGLLTDGFIPEEIAQVASPTRWRVLVKAAIGAGVLTKRHRNDHGDVGWTVVMEDNLFHVRSREEVLRDRDAAARLTRVQKVAREVRLRDGDQCRYCAKTVTFQNDRRSNRSGQYDHVLPPEEGGDESAANIVVACGGCNRRKAKGTLDAAGMQLLDPPTDPYYSPYTRKQFELDQADARDPEAATGAQVDAATARDPEAATGAQVDAATDQDRSRTARPGSDLDQPANGGSPGSGSGLVGGGSGREGLGSPDPPPTRSPRPRGSRGGKSRTRTSPAPREEPA